MPKIIDKIKEVLTVRKLTALAFSLFQISYIFILIRAFASKLIVLLFILPVVFFNFAFIEYIDKNKIDFTAKWKKIKFYSAAGNLKHHTVQKHQHQYIQPVAGRIEHTGGAGANGILLSGSDIYNILA